MKLKIMIDEDHTEEILVFAHNRTKLVDDIEELVMRGGFELFGYKDKTAVRLDMSEVVCFTVELGSVYALTMTDKYRIKERLYQLENVLTGNFIKLNQSCIANIKSISKFDASIGGSLVVIFKNGHRDFVSRRQLKSVKERLGI